MTTTAALSEWERRFEVISAEHQRLRADGMWKSGSRTLLQAVGLQHHETSLCDALVWALTPDGWHGVGVRPLRGFLARVGVPADALDDETLLEAELTREEYRNYGEPDATRADIVIRLPRVSRTVLIEAKVKAGEQPLQAERLERFWATEDPILVYLTRFGSLPDPRNAGMAEWLPLTWLAVASALREAAPSSQASPGYLEFIETLEVSGGPTRA